MGAAGAGMMLPRRDWGAGRAQGPVPGEGHLVVACWWPKQVGAASQAVEGCMWAPCRVSGRRAARGTGLEGLAPFPCPCHWGWHEGEAACPRGAQLGAAPRALGASRAAGAGEDRDGAERWVPVWEAERPPRTRERHTCAPAAPLPGPQMVSRKRRPVPPPSVLHHAWLALWPRSPAGARGWEQLGHPEPCWGAPCLCPPMGCGTLPGVPARVGQGDRGESGEAGGVGAVGGWQRSPPARQMVPPRGCDLVVTAVDPCDAQRLG